MTDLDIEQHDPQDPPVDPWDGIDLWERGAREGSQAFEAFAIYRDMGAARSTAKVARQLSKTKTLMDRWSGVWQWVRRAAAWDAEVDRRKREEAAEEIAAMHRRHAGIAQAMTGRLVASLQQMIQADVPVAPGDVPRWLDIAAKIERVARGEPAETVAQELTGSVAVAAAGWDPFARAVAALDDGDDEGAVRQDAEAQDG